MSPIGPPLVAEAHERGALTALGADLLASPSYAPGEIGADITFGSAQGSVPMDWWPHAGYLAVRSGLSRQPGRLVGVSVDSVGAPAHRLSPETREQHIRRDKGGDPTSAPRAGSARGDGRDVCEAHHGAEGLTNIARRVHRHARATVWRPDLVGIGVVHDTFFDTLLVLWVPGRAGDVQSAAKERASTSGGPMTTTCRSLATGDDCRPWARSSMSSPQIPGDHAGPRSKPRTSEFLTHPAFHPAPHRDRDDAIPAHARRQGSIDRTMIPLGSCTMKPQRRRGDGTHHVAR